MTPTEIRQFELEVYDELQELSEDPLADPAAIRDKIASFLRKVEAEIGETASE